MNGASHSRSTKNTITALYEASKARGISGPAGWYEKWLCFQYLRGVVESIIQQQDIGSAVKQINELLDESVIVEDESFSGVKDSKAGYKIEQKGKEWDLSKVDFDMLKEDFRQTTYKNIEIADLRAFLEKKLDDMLNQNRTRRDFAERLQDIIDNYNAGSTSVDSMFDDLMNFNSRLSEEKRNAIFV